MGNLGDKLAAALGVSERMQEVADPAGAQSQTENTGAKVQESAEPAESENAQQEQGTDHQEQTPEQRRVNAARRREAEQKQAVEAAVKAEREKQEAELKQFFLDAGMKNTLTDQPITSMEEFREFQKNFRRENAQKDLAAGKVTLDALGQAIEDNPTMQRMEQFLDAQQQKTGREESAAPAAEEVKEDTQPAASMWNDLPKEISAEFETIRSLDKRFQDMEPQQIFNTIMADKDLSGPFQNAVSNENKSFSQAFEDAYKLTHFDEAVTQQARGAADAQARKERGKAHLTSDSSAMRGAGAPTVPTKTMAWARAMNRGVSDAEIAAAYARDQERLNHT